MNKQRAVLIGTGVISHSHVAAMRATALVDPVACWNRAEEEKLGRDFADQHQINYYGDIDDSPFGGYYDVNLQYWFTDNLGIGFVYGKGYLTAEKDADFFKTYVWNYTMLLRLKVFPASKFNPYLTAGFEYFDIYPKGKNGHGLSSIDFNTFDKINSAIPVGFGFSYFLTDYLAIDTEALLHLTGIDNMDGLNKEGNNDNYMTLAAGLSLYLGKAKELCFEFKAPD